MTDKTKPISEWADNPKKEIIGALALAAAGFFHDEGGINYVTFGLERVPDIGPLEIIVQRKEGKTAHQLRREAEAARDALQARVEALEGAVLAEREACAALIEAGTCSILFPGRYDNNCGCCDIEHAWAHRIRARAAPTATEEG